MIFDYSDVMNNEKIAQILAQLLQIERGSEQTRLYLLYNPYTSDNQSPLFDDWQASNAIYPISYPDYASKRTPVLLELNRDDIAHQQILSESLHQALSEIHPDKLSQFKPRKVYGWLLSSLSAQLLAQQIGYIAIQPRGQHQELIRYVDPMILAPFMSILTEAQQNKVLRPVSNWLYLNGDGQLKTIQNPNKIRKHITPQLAILSDQWAQIDDIVVRNQVLTRYRKSLITADRMQESECDKIIWQALKIAKELGYTQLQDLIEYCYYSLTIHPRIMSHTKIINQIKNQSERLKTTLTRFSVQDWQEMKHDFEGIQ
ncbi:hypothetical protein RHO14_12070 [Orbus wheelerorum]|uniref:hypothetical protein n=1 Tax=Orbus wheelerorum TaxID=3074111 RepID=UPI00370DB08E